MKMILVYSVKCDKTTLPLVTLPMWRRWNKCQLNNVVFRVFLTVTKNFSVLGSEGNHYRYREVILLSFEGILSVSASLHLFRPTPETSCKPSQRLDQ